MATASRTKDLDVNSSVIYETLRDNPCSFEFFQAVRLLGRLSGGRVPVGQWANPQQEVVRFAVNNSLAFPASEIQEVEWPEEGPPRMVVNFMGLTGPLGVLPHCFSELVIGRVRAKDTTLEAFFDLFNHRIISLFYQAWEKYRFPIAYERERRDRLSHHFLDLIGLGSEGLLDRQDVLDDSLIYYSGLLSQLPRTAQALQQIVSDYFEVPVEIEQFAGAWYHIDRKTQCSLEDGDGYSRQLAVGAVVGDAVWDQQSRVRIKLGPLTRTQYLDFLPNGTAFEPLRALTRFFGNEEYDFEIQLVLKREEVAPCELGSEGPTAPQLGWVTWMKTAPMQRDPGDTILSLQEIEVAYER
jgi:type VI secretion system protein ImpH